MASKQGLQAGYDCCFVHTLTGDLQSECSICLHVLREPYLVGCCGYRFCRTCIEPIQKKAFHRCPLCNKDFSYLPDKQLERILNDKLVYCTHMSDGCEWKGKLAELEKHIDPEVQPYSSEMDQGCPYKKRKCTYCEEMFDRFAIKDHELKCTFKPVVCTFCTTHRDALHILESQHYSECPMYPVPCPNDCGEKPLRKDVSKHVDDNCPLTVLECPYQYSGYVCNAKIARSEMPNHTNMEEHLSVAAVKIKELEEENASLKARLLSKSDESASCASDSTTHNTIKYLHVTNLPPEANAQMLKSLFGQHGTVENIDIDRSAIVEYEEEHSAWAAVTRSKERGINLKSVQLSINPVFEE